MKALTGTRRLDACPNHAQGSREEVHTQWVRETSTHFSSLQPKFVIELTLAGMGLNESE